MYSSNPLKNYFYTISDFCLKKYETFEKIFNSESNLKDAEDSEFSKGNLVGIRQAKIKDKNGEYSITYRNNTETNLNEIVFGYFVDTNTYEAYKEIYENAKEFFDFLIKEFGEPRIKNDLGFSKFDENQRNHSMDAEWIIEDYKIRFTFSYVIFSEYDIFILGPFVSIESKNLNKDLQALLKVNLHQNSTYFYPYKETRYEESDQLFIIDLNNNYVYNLSTLALLKCDVSSTDSNIKLKYNTGKYIITFNINRYTAKYTQTSYLINSKELFAKSTGDVILINDKQKF